MRQQLAATWRSGVMAPRTAARPAEIKLPAELREMPGMPLETRVQITAEREALEQRTRELLQAVKRNGG